jgi:hypothetical protein
MAGELKGCRKAVRSPYCTRRNTGYAIVCVLLASIASASSADAAPHHRYRGAIHVHTTYSDGSGTFEEVMQAAQATELDYVIFSDHNTLLPLRDGHERYWGRTLALVGTEISTDAGHCLGLDLPASIQWDTRDPQAVIDRVNAAGGFTILAHPMSPRWTWTDWSVRGYTGIEIINLSSLFDDDLLAAADGLRIDGRSITRLVEMAQRYLADPDRTMYRITNSEVDRERNQWDRLLRQGRQVVGTGAVDAHARIPVAGTVFRVPTYQEAFESVQTYAVTLAPLRRQLAPDKGEIYRAYRNGRLYMVYPRVAPAPEFEFYAQEGDREAIMGQPMKLDSQVRLIVRAPGHPRPLIRLMRDGREVATAEDERLEWTTSEPGAYRAEVYAAERAGRLLDPLRGLRLPTIGDLLRTRRLDLRPWIYANPITIRR